MKKFKSIITVAIALSVTVTAFIGCSGDDDDGGGAKNWCYVEAGGMKACTHIDMLAQAGATSCDEMGGTLIENCTDKGLEYCYIEASGSCTAVNKGQCATMTVGMGEVIDDCNEILDPSSSGDKDNMVECYISDLEECGLAPEKECTKYDGEVVKSCESINDMEACHITDDEGEDCFYTRIGDCLEYYEDSAARVIETCGF